MVCARGRRSWSMMFMKAGGLMIIATGVLSAGSVYVVPLSVIGLILVVVSFVALVSGIVLTAIAITMVVLTVLFASVATLIVSVGKSHSGTGYDEEGEQE